MFPTDHLLDHIPALIQELAAYLRAPETEAVVANTAVISKAQELGELRHTQAASVHQLLAEYRLLGGILTNFVQTELQQLGVSPGAGEAVEVLRRLNEAIWLLMQTTVNTFVAEYTATISSHAARLESFNRMVSHELRQPLGTLMYALPLLRTETDRGDMARQEHLLAVMERNVLKLTQLMEQLESLSRLRTDRVDVPDVQRTDVATVAWEVARQLREMADARGVDITVSEPLPELVIDTARLELILMNLMSNAVKTSDPDKSPRVVSVETVPCETPDSLCIAVRDNGLGIPARSGRDHLPAGSSERMPSGIQSSGFGDLGSASRLPPNVPRRWAATSAWNQPSAWARRSSCPCPASLEPRRSTIISPDPGRRTSPS